MDDRFSFWPCTWCYTASRRWNRCERKRVICACYCWRNKYLTVLVLFNTLANGHMREMITKTGDSSGEFKIKHANFCLAFFNCIFNCNTSILNFVTSKASHLNDLVRNIYNYMSRRGQRLEQRSWQKSSLTEKSGVLSCSLLKFSSATTHIIWNRQLIVYTLIIKYYFKCNYVWHTKITKITFMKNRVPEDVIFSFQLNFLRLSLMHIPCSTTHYILFAFTHYI